MHVYVASHLRRYNASLALLYYPHAYAYACLIHLPQKLLYEKGKQKNADGLLMRLWSPIYTERCVWLGHRHFGYFCL